MGKWERVVSPEEFNEAIDPSGRVGRQLRKNVKKGTRVVTKTSIKGNQSIIAKGSLIEHSKTEQEHFSIFTSLAAIFSRFLA